MIQLLPPLFLVILSFGTIVFLFAKYRQTAPLLDVENIPDVQEEQKKHAYLRRKVQDRAEKSKEYVAKKSVPLFQLFQKVQKEFRRYVGRVERELFSSPLSRIRKGTVGREAEGARNVARFLEEAEKAGSEGDFEGAEQAYLSAINLDIKNFDAYKGLADIYFSQGHWREAEETYQFLRGLDPSNDGVFVKLADLAERSGDTEKAVGFIEQALLLNPNISSRFKKLADLLVKLKAYPTALEALRQATELDAENEEYLDMLIETAILAGDKKAAEEGLSRFRMMDPESRKVELFRDKISHLS